MNVLLGITGSIAAYKAADIANTLTKEGHSVKTIMTKGGAAFITPLTLQTLTKQPVYTDVFCEDDPSAVQHISLAQWADVVVIAPASADIIAKIAAGTGDDMLSTTMLAAWKKPRIVCPAMNTDMYENPVTQRNLKTLAELGFTFVEPKADMLACGVVGKGALANIPDILDAVRAAGLGAGEQA